MLNIGLDLRLFRIPGHQDKRFIIVFKNTLFLFSGHSRNSSTVENIVLDQNRTTSESEFSGLENISNYLNSNRKEKLNKNLEAPILSHEQVMALKDKKKLLTQGTELFNTRPDKGILFLQESGVLNPVLDPVEVAHFLRENPGLDKKMIGEYISKKKNVEIKILETFVNSFDFTNLRVDEALRLYLETFRLPGEAPLIFLVLEHFSEHWHVSRNYSLVYFTKFHFFLLFFIRNVTTNHLLTPMLLSVWHTLLLC